MKNRTVQVHEPRPQLPSRVAWVNEPNVRECRPSARWRLLFLQLRMTGQFEIEIQFVTRDNHRGMLRIDNSRRADVDWIRRVLESRNARLPHDKKQALGFVERLVRSTPANAVIARASPGWCNGATGFVMPYKRYGSARGQFIWSTREAPPNFGRMEGNLEAYQQTVLTMAQSSPYLSLVILVALAGPLVDYVETKLRVRLLSETAVFHFAGESSSGKTTLASVAQSVFGSPEIDTDYEASNRGIAEHAYRRNNLASVIDDTESLALGDPATLDKMLKLAQHIPRGRTKAISGRSTRSDLPDLRWSCNAISSGPETVAELAALLRRRRHGDRARLLDVKLPSAKDGGIFGSPVTANQKPAGNSARLVRQLEAAILSNHGVLLDAWVEYLIANDAAARIVELFNKFVSETASGAIGLEQRFAGKFAILYAAGRVGVESRLLPWPRDWPMRAVGHCYENSLRQRDPESAVVAKAIRRLACSLNSTDHFPRFVGQRGRYPRWGDNQIGLRRASRGTTETFFARERLGIVCDPEAPVGGRVFDRLLELKVIKAGASEQLRVQTPEREVVKVRFWKVDAPALARWATSSDATRADTLGRNQRSIRLESRQRGLELRARAVIRAPQMVKA